MVLFFREISDDGSYSVLANNRVEEEGTTREGSHIPWAEHDIGTADVIREAGLLDSFALPFVSLLLVFPRMRFSDPFAVFLPTWPL